jgi:hypothetical protein
MGGRFDRPKACWRSNHDPRRGWCPPDAAVELRLAEGFRGSRIEEWRCSSLRSRRTWQGDEVDRDRLDPQANVVLRGRNEKAMQHVERALELGERLV